RLSRIVTRASGYIEKLYVNKTFVSVKEDEPLVELYSPELYTATQELLVAGGAGGSALVDGTREKLRLLGVGETELDEIVKAGKPRSKLVIRSPQRGHVIHRAVVQGGHVNAGDTLFEVADLSQVWIEADVFERDIPFVREGAEIHATVEAFPERVFSGQVSLVHPHLRSETRTNQVRFVVDNRGHELRPGMFASVKIRTPLVEGLAVPEGAVIDTGSRKIVYVERAPGVFEGTLVELGPRTAGYYPVAKGLVAGERVAAAGAFLVDAETRLNPGAAGTFTGSMRAPAQPTLSADDRAEIAKQKKCPIGGDPLGGMGDPVKILLEGRLVFLCCAGCEGDARKDPKKTLETVRKLRGESQ
ncbi:MAG: efflux RND transporter periplasmic adaptor subunit, partial [Planctomycetota bacterium]